MSKIHYGRINNIRICIDSELINFIDYTIREKLESEDNGFSAADMLTVTDNNADYTKTHRFIYTPELAIRDFYEIFKEICVESPYLIYVNKEMIQKYFKGFSINIAIKKAEFHPQLVYQEVDLDSLKDYIREKQEEWKAELL